MQSPGAAGGDSLLTVTVVRDEHGYGMKVSGDNPVYVQSVKEHGAAWRAGLRAGDRILRVDGVPVHHHTHHKVVLMIRSNPSTVLTVHQNIQRQKTPITAPVPVNSEKQRQLECSKVNTVRLMLHNERQFIAHLKSELQKVPDVRKQAELETAEKRCAQLQKEIDTIVAAQPDVPSSTPRPNRHRASLDKVDKLDKSGSPPTPTNTGFLSGLPRSLSNLTGQSLRNLREKKNKIQQENTPPLVRQNSDESNNRKRHNNTVPIVPTTCLDNSPPPLPPRSIRNPLTPNTTPVNPLAKPKPSSSVTSVSATQFFKDYKNPMHQSMPAYRDNPHQLRRSSHSLDGDLEGPQPNSIALQMSYPLVNAPPPPLQMDTRGAPVLHVRSQSSPEHLEHSVHRTATEEVCPELWERSPPPGTPPPPYAHNTQPCADPQRAIISMEEDDPPSENSSYSGLFSNLRTVRESKARFAVLLNWLLGERRCACAALLLLVTDGYRGASVPISTLRRWAYEIQSTFLTPHAALKLTHADEQMANDIDHILLHEYEKEEILRNVFRKARQKAKEELTQQLEEFQIKRQVGLGTLYGPDDAVLHTASVDKAQEQVIVERITLQLLRGLAAPDCATDARAALLAAVTCACTALGARPATLAAAVGGSRPTFLQRDKVYKQRLKQLTKQNPQPFVVRGHHLQLQALTSVAHCHACDLPLWGLAPQAYVCTDCNLRVHRTCTKAVEEPCCLDSEHHNNRISRFMERIHHNNTTSNPDSGEKKSRKTSSTAHFLNMERSVRKMEDDSTWDAPPQHAPGEWRLIDYLLFEEIVWRLSFATVTLT
ncbi:hypothetical protein JYU34_022446 [Plutella xylostella]|uniref:Rho guanine nucleotide exchange factor 12 n=1 Tax=Plutella xylostella TaxID=51655 RepID=A0ABQ7PQY7_PLUXY|nr:hypothetical protein JYU34_022446 [Plutella xylostella]